MIGRTCVDLDTGQEERQFQVFQAGRLGENVLVREIVATLFQNLNSRLRDRYADLVLRIVYVA